ncbi:uroporphyrinogen decarboxylase family protein [Raineyella sp. W15-4]|uniref:uroporphyrinogen decarboxylase family protein n=1 Tax=Raineyella sp. W15-4 TaxID=3081651 RepID=UPI002954D6FF|nr:uroporphyrinogen decarboxylase family protein [Raineyella sp. W15-4]WOQ16928.1 uroporphyrinogen decarboxylase family protein [Raineyella sp. W15-4]
MAVQTTAVPDAPTGSGPAPADRRAEFAVLLRGTPALQHGDATQQHGDATQQHNDTAEHSDPPRRFLTSAWQHFVGEEYDPVRFATATVDFNRTWDWDWVKINPRAVYYSEAWGAVYDPDDYVGVIPRLVSPAIAGVADLATVRPLDPATNPVLAEHLTSAALIREQLPDRALLQTVFSPLSVLLQLAGLPLYPGDVVPGATVAFSADELLTSDPAATHRALAAIARTLGDYARRLVAPVAAGGAGLDGIFYAVTGTANSDLVARELFEEFSRPYDRQVLDAVGDGLVVLHTCGADSHPEWFTDDGVDALHWDQFLPGNPQLDTPFGVTVVGGANKDLFGVDGDPAEVAAQLAATLAAAPDRPFLLAPSCTVPTPADPAALRQLRDAG